MKKRYILFLTAIFICISSFAQEIFFMDGVPKDDGAYDLVPRKKEMVAKGTSSLPSSCSLLSYCPSVQSQGGYGTCSCWAAIYAARTIAEAVNQGWTDKEQIDKEAFAPLFTYARIKSMDDSLCQKGTRIHHAFNAMKRDGVPKLETFDKKCANLDDILETPNLAKEAINFKIENYSTLFSNYCKDSSLKINMVRKAISEKRPVVIAMWLDRESFRKTKDLLNLQGLSSSFPQKIKPIEGYHAMCVVGYDDNKYGGAFLIMNSWGTSWGNKGFFWARYEDFARTVDQAFDFFVAPPMKPAPKPDPKIQPQPEPTYCFMGSFEMWHIKTPNGKPTFATKEMATIFNPRKNIPCYHLIEGIRSGDKLRLYLDNHEPAYVYIIVSDAQNNIDIMFPFGNYSPALTYKSNPIALPDEDHTMQVDNTTGTDYWLLLYSKEELDINSIVGKLKNTSGTFFDKVTSALDDKMVPLDDIRFVENSIEFNARSKKSIITIVVEAEHTK